MRYGRSTPRLRPDESDLATQYGIGATLRFLLARPSRASSDIQRDRRGLTSRHRNGAVLFVEFGSFDEAIHNLELDLKLTRSMCGAIVC